MKIPLKASVKGQFKFTIRDGKTLAVKRETEWMDNLILDAGLNRYGTGIIWGVCQVGTSNTAPAVGQTALVALVASTTVMQTFSSSAQPSAPYYKESTIVYRFDVGVAAGNLSEVGVGWGTSNSLWSRALIVDGLGDPTTITVLPTEVLDVAYKLRTSQVEADVNFDVSIGGVLRNCVLRPAQITTAPTSNPFNGHSVFRGTIDTSQGTVYTGALGAVTASPAGSAAAHNTASLLAYSNNSLKRVARCEWGLNNGNFSIAATKFASSLGQYQISFSPPLPKDNTKTLVLDFEWTWARG